MTFALFVGAGNIIFPPMIGLQAGANVWLAALGFLVTGVGLPVLAIIAVARCGGEMHALTAPIGARAGVVMTVVCYLAIGPLFATPRTATVSFELGVLPFTHGVPHALWIYSAVYFSIVALISLFPGRLLDVVGRVLAPIKITSLVVLGLAAFMMPSGLLPQPEGLYASAPVAQGVINGYLTMDTLGALVFGLVIVNAIRSRGITDARQMTRYTVIAGLIAGVGLSLIYICLFRLGADSQQLAHGASNGAVVLQRFVQQMFGATGSIFLSVLINLACLVTAVGLTCSCASYFGKLLPVSYAKLVLFFAGFSFLVSNLGLTELIKVSVPVLTAIYPPFVAMIVLSLLDRVIRARFAIVAPVTAVSLLFGAMDGLRVAGLDSGLSGLVAYLPFYQQGLVWAMPALLVLMLALLIDQMRAGGHAREVEAS